MRGIIAIIISLFSIPLQAQEGPARDAVELQVRARLPSGYALESFEFRNFPSKVETGVGRTSVAGKMRLERDLFARSNFEWVRGRLIEEFLEAGMDVGSVDQLIADQLSPRLNVEMRRISAAGSLADFEMSLRYAATVTGIDFHSLSVAADQLPGTPRAEIPDRAFVAGSEQGERVVASLLAEQQACLDSASAREELQGQVRDFFAAGALVRLKQEKSGEQTLIYDVRCNEFSPWRVEDEDNASFMDVVCMADFAQPIRFHNVGIKPGMSRRVWFKVRVHGEPGQDPTARVRAHVLCEGDDGGVFCEDGQWHGSVGWGPVKTLAWTGSEFRGKTGYTSHYDGEASILTPQ